jgi:hypothetical protein
MQNTSRPGSEIKSDLDRLIAEFRQATDPILPPDPELGALICAAYELDGELPPLRLYKGAA